jgi:ferredoxin/flavodoxin
MNLYYFSGTGNSIAIVRELQKHLKDAELSPIVRHLGDDEVRDDSEVIGFVTPTYYMDIPDIVRDFTKKLSTNKNAFIFAVIHYGVTPGRAFHSLNELLLEKGAKLNAGFGIVLPDNSIALKTPIRNQLEMHALMPQVVEDISSKILEKRSVPLPGSNSQLLGVNGKIGSFVLRKIFGTERKRTTSDCTHCGICERVCPVNNITVYDDDVSFGDNCADCFACIHWCPEKAIRYGILKVNSKSHYTNPAVCAADMMAQK